jgi:lipopolysaccharide transport system permease protein
MLMYTAPVVYPLSKIPAEYLWIYCLNPVVAIVEGFRACILGYPLSVAVVVPGALVAFVVLISGVFYFQHIEHIFVDVV